MPTSLRVCNKPGCGTLVERGARGGKCAVHQAEDRKLRGNPRAPGKYDAEHQRTRARLLPAALGRPCPVAGPKCHGAITRQNARLDHTEALALNPHSRGDRIICDGCNASLGGQLGAQFRDDR